MYIGTGTEKKTGFHIKPSDNFEAIAASCIDV